MSYVDGMVAAVPTANKEAYLAHARASGAIFMEFGATGTSENWGDDVPPGKVTDFQRAVQSTDDETIVFSWISWPDKATRDAGWEKIMADPRLAEMPMPFDGKRMIYAGFANILKL